MRIVRISSGKLQLIEERSYRDRDYGGFGESSLQELLVDHPEVIPSEDIDSEDPPRFVVIQREAGVTAGSIDILLVDHQGVPTIIETKLLDNREIRRSVVAQGLEYLAHVATEWNVERFVAAGMEFWQARKVDFADHLQDRLGDLGQEEWRERLRASLADGRLRLIIAADRLPTETQRLLEFLNAHADFEVLGLQVRRFAAAEVEGQFLVPRLTGGSVTMRDRRRQRQGIAWNRELFFERLEAEASDESVALASDLLAFAIDLTGESPDWGKGKERGSFTAKMHLLRERYSLFSVYTSGDLSINLGWKYQRYPDLGWSDADTHFRRRVADELGLEFDETTWRRGWPAVKLDWLSGAKMSEFKSFMRSCADELREHLGETAGETDTEES